MTAGRIASWSVPSSVLVLSLAFAQTASVAPQPLTVDGAGTRVYKSTGEGELRLHIFSPDGSDTPGTSPAIVFFFGGGWATGSVTQFARQARYFADRGMVAIVADYRVFGRHRTSAFEAMADAKSAVRWVRAHATELRVDSNRVVAAGGSAGGHIALSAAVFDAYDTPGEDTAISSKPNALVLFNPVVDTAVDDAVWRDRFRQHGRDGSPYHHMSVGLPPMIILHGKADTTVPFASVDRFCAEARKLSSRCQLVGYEGARHGFFNSDTTDGKWYSDTLREADRFLTEVGYLRALATK